MIPILHALPFGSAPIWQPDGYVTVAQPDGQVVSVQPNGSIQFRPSGTAGPYELATQSGNTYVYNPTGSVAIPYVFYSE